MVFPIFAIVLAYNIANGYDSKTADRSLLRIAVAAFIAQPFYAWAFGYVFPLNVLFTLAAGVYVATKPSRWLGLCVGLIAGAFVDYAWFGIAVVASACWYFRAPSWAGRFWLAAAVASPYFINHNFWALAAFPLLVAAQDLDMDLPRWRWSFLTYYVAHLLALCIAARL